MPETKNKLEKLTNNGQGLGLLNEINVFYYSYNLIIWDNIDGKK